MESYHFHCIKPKEDENPPPRVKQCYKCQMYDNHFASECVNSQKCLRCAEAHPKSACQKKDEEANCANCSGNHFASSKICEVYKAAVSKQSQGGASYANAAKKNINPTAPMPQPQAMVLENQIQLLFEKMLSSLALAIAEVVAKSVGNLMYELFDKKMMLTGKGISVIAKDTASALNNEKVRMFANQKLVNGDKISEEVSKRILNPAQNQATDGKSQPGVTQDSQLRQVPNPDPSQQLPNNTETTNGSKPAS